MKIKINYIHIVVFFTAILLTFIVFSEFKNGLIGVSSTNAASTITVPQFPADHAAHPGMLSEWWYLNLQVNTVSNSTDFRDLAYILSFSRVNGSNGLLSSRYDDTSKSFVQATDTGGSLTGTLTDNLLTVTYTRLGTSLVLKQSASTNGMRFTLTGKTPQIGSVNLQLNERNVGNTVITKPLLWGCNGIISVFGLNDTAYYSMVNFDVSGVLTDPNGVSRSVRAGKAWIDHQWFNTLPPADWKGHYWLTNHLSSTSDFLNKTVPNEAVGFVTQVYSTGNKYSYWVRRRANGTNECGMKGTGQVLTKASSGYPSSMRLQLWKPAAQVPFMDVVMYATSANQKINPPRGPAFVETVARTKGTLESKNVFGIGIIETHIK